MVRHAFATAAVFTAGVRCLQNTAHAEGWYQTLFTRNSVDDDALQKPLSEKPGRLFIWGGPRFGRVPREVQSLPDVVKVAVSDALCVAVAADGRLFAVQSSAPLNSPPDRQQRRQPHQPSANAGGPSIDDKHTDELTEALETSIGRPVDVAVTDDSSAIVVADKAGRVSVIECQHPAENHPENSKGLDFFPGRILEGEIRRARIKKVRCGSNHCLAISADGSTYAWGDNSHGQLGVQRKLTDRRNEEGFRIPAAVTSHSTPVRVALPAGVRIVDADCGENHSILLSEDGRVYAAGDGRWAQLGITAEPWVKGASAAIEDVRLAQCIKDLPIREISCGAQHTLALVADGTLVSFGANSHGQLGHHNICSFAPPSPVANTSLRGKSIRAGRNHSCLLSVDGDLYCIGSGDAGQLGHGPRQRTAVWRCVKKLRDHFANDFYISYLDAGGDTTAVILARTESTVQR